MLSSQQSVLKLLQQKRCFVTSETVDQPVAGSTVYFFEKEAGAASGNYRRQIPHSCRRPANDAPSKDRGQHYRPGRHIRLGSRRGSGP